MKTTIFSFALLLSVSITYSCDQIQKNKMALAKLVGTSEYGRTIIHERIEYYCNKKDKTDTDFEELKTNITEMVEFGIDINAQERDRKTALHIAVEHACESLVSFLLQNHKADPNGGCYPMYPNAEAASYISAQQSPLMKACELHNNKSIIKLLLDHGANPNLGYLKTISSLESSFAPKSCITPLMETCHSTNNNKAAIDLLLHCNADIKQLFTYVYTHHREKKSCYFDIIKKYYVSNAATIISCINNMTLDKKNELLAFIEKKHIALNEYSLGEMPVPMHNGYDSDCNDWN